MFMITAYPSKQENTSCTVFFGILTGILHRFFAISHGHCLGTHRLVRVVAERTLPFAVYSGGREGRQGKMSVMLN